MHIVLHYYRGTTFFFNVFQSLQSYKNNYNCLLKQHNNEETYYLNTCCMNYYRSFTKYF